MTRTADIQKIPHQYLPQDFILTNWESLEPFFKELSERPIDSKVTLEKWLML
jgi:oligoendopeptidase F